MESLEICNIGLMLNLFELEVQYCSSLGNSRHQSLCSTTREYHEEVYFMHVANNDGTYLKMLSNPFRLRANV